MGQAILFRKRGDKIMAFDGEPLGVDGRMPKKIVVEGDVFDWIPSEFGKYDNNFLFWDEFHNEDGSTIGYAFSLTEKNSDVATLLKNASNCKMFASDWGFELFLAPVDISNCEAEQYFESCCYRNNENGEVILMIDDKSDHLAFPLHQP